MSLEPIFKFIEVTWRILIFWTVLDEWEEGIILRLGKYHRKLERGFHWKWPLIEICHSNHTNDDNISVLAQSLTTLDKRNVKASASMKYNIFSITRFITNIDDPDNVMQDLVAGALAGYVMSHTFNDCIDYDKITSSIKNTVSEEVKRYGVNVVSIHVEDMQLSPEEVIGRSLVEAAKNIKIIVNKK